MGMQLTLFVVRNPCNSDNYILGTDVSGLAWFIDNGDVFIETDGNENPLLVLLKNHGFNYIRLCTFVEPSADYSYASVIGTWFTAKKTALAG